MSLYVLYNCIEFHFNYVVESGVVIIIIYLIVIFDMSMRLTVNLNK